MTNTRPVTLADYPDRQLFSTTDQVLSQGEHSIVLASEPRVTFATGQIFDAYHGLSGVTLEAKRSPGVQESVSFLVEEMLHALVKGLQLSRPSYAVDLKYEDLAERCTFGQAVVLPVDWNDPIESHRFCCCGAEPQVTTRQISDVAGHVAAHPGAWSCCGCGVTISDFIHFDEFELRPQSVAFSGMCRLAVSDLIRLRRIGCPIDDTMIAKLALSQRRVTNG